MFKFSSIEGADDLSIPQNAKERNKNIIPLKEEEVRKMEKKKAEEENEGEEEEEEEEKEPSLDPGDEKFDPNAVLPFAEIGEFLLLHFKKNPEKKAQVLDFEHPETKEVFRIHCLKFYNSFMDFPVKIRIRGRYFVFKQVMSMFPDYYAMETYKMLNEHWAANNVKARIFTYTVFPLCKSVKLADGNREFCFCGFIHFCEGPCMMNVSCSHLLKLVLDDPKKREELEDAFIQSMIGSTIGNYLVGLGDRHNYNVLLTPDVKVAHIDLNAVFGEQEVPLEKMGVIGAPSLYMPKSVVNFLKHEKIKKMEYFKTEFLKAFACLPEFEDLRKVLAHEAQMKFLHDRMFGSTGEKVLNTLFLKSVILRKELRDFFAREVAGAGPKRLELKDKDYDLVHIICSNIYRVSEKGLFSLEHKENIWGNVKKSFARNQEGDQIFLISSLTGWIYVYYWKEGKFRVISKANWKSAKGVIYHQGYLYIVAQGLGQGKMFRLSVEDSQWKVLSKFKKLDWVKKIWRSANLFGRLYMFEKTSNVMYVFDPKEKVLEKKEVKNVEKFLIGRRVVGCEAHNCIYFLDPSIYSLGMEDGMQEVRKCSKKDWKGVKAAVEFGSSKKLLVVEGEELVIWDPAKDEKKKISYEDKKWGKTTLAF